MQAFDVAYRTPGGDERTAVLIDRRGDAAEQIRQTLFGAHPEATDYSFREFDYLQFQMRSVLRIAVGQAWDMATLHGENFIDESEV
jgi:hypothetical protein